MANRPVKKKIFVTTNWRSILSMWSNISNSLMVAVAGWYAAGDAPKSVVGPELFATIIAVWTLLTIVLTNLNQNLPKE